MNAAEHLDLAKSAMARNHAQDATAHALIAIAEFMAVNTAEVYGSIAVAGVEAGAMATAEAIGEIGKIVGGNQ